MSTDPTVIRVPDWVEHPPRPLLHVICEPHGDVHPSRLRRRDHRTMEDLRTGRAARARHGVLSAAARSARNAGRLLHACCLAGSPDRCGAPAAADVGARMVDERRAMAARSGFSCGVGEGARVRTVHTSGGIARRHHFELRPAITRQSYLRVFERDRFFYAVARLGQLARPGIRSPASTPVPTRSGTPPTRTGSVTSRCSAQQQLHVFFTAIGDAPERVLMSTIDLTPDWMAWRASSPVDVLQPERPYECADMAAAPSQAGDVEERVRQIRDPFVFEEHGQTFLFYSTCGEQGIAGARLSVRPSE